MKIIATTNRAFVKYDDLINKLEDHNNVFYNSFIEDLDQISELTDKDEKILMLDELNVKDEFLGVNSYLEEMNNVKYICSLSSRYHDFDIKKANQLGIRYCNNPDTTSQSVAELAIMHMMLLIRKQPLYENTDFEFYGANNLGRELGALSVGILGYGNIGGSIAELCNSLGMDVKIWSRTKKDSKYSQVEIQELLQQDVVFISVISGEESKALFNENFFGALDETKYIVDIVADDTLYEKDKLIKMCNQGKLGGFGFEKDNPNSKYISISGNVSTSPHVAWATEEGYRKLIEGWVNTVLSAYKGKPINVVNK